MRRFLINNPKFTGQAEIWYNERDTLCKIDCTGTDMDQMTISHFKHALPSTVQGLLQGKGFTQDTTIVEAGYEVTFEQFYADYPLKRNRFKAEEVFKRMNKVEQAKAFNSLHFYKGYCTRNSSWYTPMIADKYLRNREYETEWNKIK